MNDQMNDTTWFVVVRANHNEQGTVLWETETQDKQNAEKLAQRLSDTIPSHAFTVSHFDDAVEVFKRDVRSVLNEFERSKIHAQVH